MSDGFFRNSEVSSFKRRPLPPSLNLPRPTEPPVKKPNSMKGLDEWQQVMDIECYPNYFLIKFMRIVDEHIVGFEQVDELGAKLDRTAIEAILDEYEIITFKGNGYDIPILRLALAGASNRELYDATCRLISGKVSPWKFSEEYELPEFAIDHIDLEGVAPGVAISLKLYGGRLHCKRMQDLPYDPHQSLFEDEMENVDAYCDRDLDKTKLMFLDLLPQIELRRELTAKYGIDLRSKSDAQIAEAVITAELRKKLPRGERYLERRVVEAATFRYKAPSFISFRNKELQDALDLVTTDRFTIKDNGTISMPESLKNLKIKIGDSVYRMGMGGLHSTEKTVFHIVNDQFSLWDWDVTSYYPSIILRCGLYPEQLGKVFLDVYGNIVDERVAAKAAGDKVKADCFKIVVNGSFGKLGSPYSALYAPELLIQVTVTGQLSLLMLIEMMENKGIPVVSGNTDGIVLKCPKGKEEMMELIIKRWEKLTGFTMESSQYLGLYSRDVNNYIAVKPNGDVKRKGCYAPAGLTKNPEHEICAEAMIDYIRYGTPIEDTIRQCRDITKFVTVRSVTGGAVKQYGKFIPVHSSKEELIRMAGFEQFYGEDSWLKPGEHDRMATSTEGAYSVALRELAKYDHAEYLGKAVRWYYSTVERGAITYLTNGKQVAVTEDCKPIMDITIPFPDDMDYLWYINKAKELFA